MNQKRQKKSPAYRLITGALLALWMILIFCYSAQPAAESSQVSGGVCDGLVAAFNETFHMQLSGPEQAKIASVIEFPVRKLAHMAEYAVLAVLFFLFFRGYGWEAVTEGRLAFLCAAVYAAADEFHQYFVPGRAARVTDMLVDAAGALLGLLAFLFIASRFRRKR